MKFIVAMLIVLSGVFLVGLIFAAPLASKLTSWEAVFAVISGIIMGLAGIALIGIGIWLGNNKGAW